MRNTTGPDHSLLKLVVLAGRPKRQERRNRERVKNLGHTNRRMDEKQTKKRSKGRKWVCGQVVSSERTAESPTVRGEVWPLTGNFMDHLPQFTM